MTTPLALAQARAEQAIADREGAELALAKAMVAAGISIPPWATAAEVATWRIVESRLEHPATGGTALARTHAAYRRAQRAEGKAASAARRARWTAEPRTPVQRQPAGLTANDVLRGLSELRGELVAA